MEELKLSLRIKSKKSQNATIRDVSTKQTVAEFLERLSPMTDIPVDQMSLLKGFPPKKIAYNKSALLESLELINQDTLIVELDPSGKAGNETPLTVKDSLVSSSNRTNDHQESTEVLFSGETSRAGPSVLPLSQVNASDQVSSSAAQKNQHIINALNSSTMRDLENTRSSPAEEFGTDISSLSSVPIINPMMMNQSFAEFQERVSSMGVMLRQVVPSDNSCLFRSVVFCLSGSVTDNDGAREMRELIAASVASDPERFSEAILGRPNRDYQTWILKNESWGGGIELMILSESYRIEIDVVDIQSLSISRFGEDKNYSDRMILLYDGIHYDPLYMEMFDGTPIKTQFSVLDESILEKSLQLGSEAKAAHLFTDLRNFSLKCGICNLLLRGQTEAQYHAKNTGHVDFRETV